MSRPESTPELELTWDRALAWRVGRQLIQGRPSPNPVNTASVLCGVQTQVVSSAVQVLTIRGKGVADLDTLLWKERSLVKTWAMRGTLHLLPANELGFWFAALRQRPWKITAAWERYHGISRAQLAAITETIPVVVSDTPMTREELTEAIVARAKDPKLGEALSSGWSQVLKPAANQGLLAQGPPRGKNVTFVDPRRWADPSPEVDPESAMREMVRRFLDANGPATTNDFARWFGVDPKTGRELMSPFLEDLVTVSIEGQVGWVTTRGAEELTKAEPEAGTHLLPGFDPYTLAPIGHREHTIPEGRVAEVSRPAGWIAPVILDGARIIGTWESAKDGTISLGPFQKMATSTLTAIRDHVEQRYHGLLGEEPRVTVAG